MLTLQDDIDRIAAVALYITHRHTMSLALSYVGLAVGLSIAAVLLKIAIHILREGSKR